MERIELDTSVGTHSVFFEPTLAGITICNLPFIGQVTVRTLSAKKFCTRMLEICASIDESLKSNKTRQL